jgi:hypothetical protein
MLLPMGADPDYTTLSGFSGGCFMADNLNIIHSSTFKAVGLMAGGTYQSAIYYPSGGIGNFPGSATEEDIGVLWSPEEFAEESVSRANANADLGLIDDLSNLENKPVYIL